MNPTPTETPCPSLSHLRRLLQPDLPEAEAAPLREHLRVCLGCQQIWQNLQAEITAGQTPPALPPIGDTSPGHPLLPTVSSAIVPSSEVSLEGPGSQRPPAQPPPSTQEIRMFPFLSPPREEGELGWLAHYRVTGVLGEGGMGYVFDAFDTSLHRRVALKVLKPDLAANKSFRERFLLEARAAAALPDDYIVTIYQVDIQNDVPFLAMKFLYGESLEQLLQREGRLRPLEIMRIGREIALGLSAAHERGLIHRDIKPANLWLETPPPQQKPDGSQRLSFEHLYRVKILDFGLARPIHESHRLTATGLIVGTPQYLAPEQARGRPLDHRCDLFSLGIVLYRMATGILPFDGSDTLAQLTALAVAEPRPIEELAPDVPAGLRRLIHQLLARDPAKRPQTARAVAEALHALEKSATPTVPLLEREERSTEGGEHKSFSLRSLSRLRRRSWLLAGGLLVLMFGSSGLWLWRNGPPHSPADAENAAAGASKDPIKVGVLFSKRGPMMSGGSASHEAADLAVEELNEQGGLLGRRIIAVHRDGASDYRKFREEAEKLITEDRVCVIFGTRASVNRKAVKEVVEKYDHLLFYPMQFEGLEESPNIVYLGVAPNQQIFPAIDYMHEQGKHRLFLVGSDYVYPRAANEILRYYLESKYRKDMQIVGEKYIPYGGTRVQETIEAIQKTKPDLIVNTLNGDTNVPFFRELYEAGFRAASTPVLSFSVGKNDLLSIGETAIGHYAVWSYFQRLDRAKNREFVRKFQKRFNDPQRVISDPMETVYFGVHLWAQAVKAAGSIEPRAVRQSIGGCEYEAPEGRVYIDRKTHYTWRNMHILRVNPELHFEDLYDYGGLIPPTPFPSMRPRSEWIDFLNNLYIGWSGSWIAEGKR